MRKSEPFASFIITCLLLLAVSTTGRIQAVPASTLSPTGQSATALRPAVTPDLPVPFRVGESLTYDVSWTNAIPVGTAVFEVKERRALAGGYTAYNILAEAKPGSLVQSVYPLYYKLQTDLDTKTLLPLQAYMYSQERSRTRTKVTTFVSPTTINYEFTTASRTRTTRSVEPKTLDPLSLIFVIRTLMVLPGKTLTLPFTDSGNSYHAVLLAADHQQMTTGAGTFPVTRLNVTITDAKGIAISGRGLSVWITDDARRLPVRMDTALPVGSFILKLSHIAG